MLTSANNQCIVFMWVYFMFRYVYLLLYENKISFVIYFGKNIVKSNINFEMFHNVNNRELSGGKGRLCKTWVKFHHNQKN